jgi:serine protease inhibitor
MKAFKSILLLSMLNLTACDSNYIEPENKPNLRTLSVSETEIVKSSNQFAFDLFVKAQTQNPENTFLSPLSVGIALAMTLNGADRETKQQIKNAIQFGNLTDEEINQGYKGLIELLLSMDRKVSMGLANSVWYKKPLLVQDNFSNTIRDYYDGTVQGLDFSNANSKGIINQWIESKTNNKIQDMIKEIDPADMMFLVNAIYFKGDWTYQFDKTKTHEADFKKKMAA